MPIIFLIYILVCYKTGLEVYWYDWVLFVLLEIFAVARILYTEDVKKAYQRGLQAGHGEEEEKTGDIFSDV